MNELVSKKLAEYKDFAEPFKHMWNEKDKAAILIIYGMLKLERTNGSLTNQIHDEDLQLLSGCLLHACGKPEQGLSGYLPEGVLYLVTNDKDFFTGGKQVLTLEAMGVGKGKKINRL